MDTFLAGVAEVVITPPLGTHLIEPRGERAQGSYGDLCARVLAISDGNTIVAIVTLDLVGLDGSLVQAIRQAVHAACSPSPDCLMLAPTHNHNAPVTIGWDDEGRRAEAWEAHFVQATAQAVKRAVGSLGPARLSTGRSPVQIGVNRRVAMLSNTHMQPNPHGPAAPWVDVLRVDSSGGRTLAALFSHAAHPVIVHGSVPQLGPDYLGFAVQALRQQLGEHVIAMPAQGCSGDINAEPLKGGLAAAQEAGARLGMAAVSATLAATPLPFGPLRALDRQIFLPVQTYSVPVAEALVQRATEAYETLRATNANQGLLADQRDLARWAKRMLEIAHDPTSCAGLPVQLQSFAIGRGAAVMGISNDVFVEYQLYLQKSSPFAHTFVFGYTNVYSGYLPTADAIALGGYEVLGAPKHIDMPYLSPECEGIIKQTALDALRQVWREAAS